MWSDINTLTVAPDLVCCSVPVQCHKYLIATLYNRNLNFMSFEYREKKIVRGNLYLPAVFSLPFFENCEY